ncbi:MAG: SCO family protein, partial [Verrucomicrobia bacterium]|nr:SCO family protein [Verrucomicrobiota bacterium]
MPSSSGHNLKFLPIAGVVALILIGAVFFVGGNARPLPVISQMRPFTLTNQHGKPVTLSTLKGKVWVAQIIFTRCPGPCLRMAQLMDQLQQSLVSNPDVVFVSLTTDPDYDTPEVLSAYSKRFSPAGDRWHFLTGTKQEIYKVAVEDMKLTSVETKPEDRTSPDELFVHSTISVVLDEQGRVRMSVEALEPEGLQKLKETVERLLR